MAATQPRPPAAGKPTASRRPDDPNACSAPAAGPPCGVTRSSRTPVRTNRPRGWYVRSTWSAGFGTPSSRTVRRLRLVVRFWPRRDPKCHRGVGARRRVPQGRRGRRHARVAVQFARMRFTQATSLPRRLIVFQWATNNVASVPYRQNVMIILPPTLEMRTRRELASFVVASMEAAGVIVPTSSRLRQMHDLLAAGGA
jgi:hypothetical protein